ncbi:MAG: hypothetical protein COA44_01385 [Arcobacter sp.]|nr:MAG: hypothetical protein COA44_01385 [Arcobacter sp.]
MSLSVLVEFAMFPTSPDGRDGAGVSGGVSKIIDMIDKSGVPYKLTPMGTVFECGSMKDALGVIEKAYECLDDCERVYSSLKFDIRKDKSNRLTSKIASVEKTLGREVKH